MKKFIATMFSLFLFSSNTFASDINMVVDGRTVKFDEPPLVENGTTYVPMRALVENVDNYMTWEESVSFDRTTDKDVILVWDEESKTIFYNKGYTDTYYNAVGIKPLTGEVNISLRMFTDGEETYSLVQSTTLNPSAKIVNGRTLLPVRAVSELLGYDVNWDNTTKTIYIDTSNLVITDLSTNEKINVNEYLNNVNSISNNTTVSNSSNNNTVNTDNLTLAEKNTISKNDITEQEKQERAEEILGYVNELRLENGLNELGLDQTLIDFAYLKAEDFNLGGYNNSVIGTHGAKGYHVSPRYGSPTDWYNELYNTDVFIMENFLATGARKGDEPIVGFDSWLDSEGHKRAMLDKGITKLGFGFYTVTEKDNEWYGSTIMLLEMY